MSSPEISNDIETMIKENERADLKRFLGRRHCLNMWNMALAYIFHLVQAAGILTTSIAAAYNINKLIWVGIGLNAFASVISVIIKTNNGFIIKMLKDIEAIEEGRYVDEAQVVEDDELDKNKITSVVGAQGTMNTAVIRMNRK